MKNALWKGIFQGDREKVMEIFEQKYTKCKREEDKNAVIKCMEYVKNIWKEISSYSLYNRIQRRKSREPCIIVEAFKLALVVE
ncbi:hypothetical protein AN618_22900 [Fervidicola ferrireducens]|uniref:Uncharacterized protein n=1 Tax=Fervidicola ferrireducens TaxID=520764 RepID=A0A140L1S1_9FIRM|nr:hypothetical protein AN618_22900 [Fervidicola ferrireducens]